MHDFSASGLPNIRRIVTGHDEEGKAVMAKDTELQSVDTVAAPGIWSSAIWSTVDGLPTKGNNLIEDGALREIDGNYKLVPPSGTNFRSTELASGASTPLHRTTSIDYNILVAGQVILVTEDGKETLLRNPGDVVVQKGTMHAWRNPSDTQWTRWVSVLVSADPAEVNGNNLRPELKRERA